MSRRTTTALVQTVLLGDYDGTSDLMPFVIAANVVTNRVVTCATARGITLLAEEKEMVERWLAAHFYVMSDQAYQSKQTSNSQATFQGKTNMYLESSKYGQSATLFDPSGCLASLARGARAQARWLGKPPSAQLDYNQRD